MGGEGGGGSCMCYKLYLDEDVLSWHGWMRVVVIALWLRIFMY